MLLEEQTEQTTHAKHLNVNCHVSGKFSELLPAEDGNRRWKRARLFCTVIAAIDYNRYHVLFDNNEVKECYLNSLRFEAATASLPPDLPPLSQIGANPEEEPDPDHPEGSEDENLDYLPPQEQAEEVEVAEEAKAEVA
jgi:hypothetical protein